MQECMFMNVRELAWCSKSAKWFKRESCTSTASRSANKPKNIGKLATGKCQLKIRQRFSSKARRLPFGLLVLCSWACTSNDRPGKTSATQTNLIVGCTRLSFARPPISQCARRHKVSQVKYLCSKPSWMNVSGFVYQCAHILSQPSVSFGGFSIELIREFVRFSFLQWPVICSFISRANRRVRGAPTRNVSSTFDVFCANLERISPHLHINWTFINMSRAILSEIPKRRAFFSFDAAVWRSIKRGPIMCLLYK